MIGRLIPTLAAAIALAATLIAPAPAAAASDCEPAVPTFGLCGLDVAVTGRTEFAVSSAACAESTAAVAAVSLASITATCLRS